MIVTIEEDGYTPVRCENPLPCPFCGCWPKLSQLAHTMQSQKVGRKYVQGIVCIISSTSVLTADTFWFKCSGCGCTSGGHHTSASAAAEAWNRRYQPTKANQILERPDARPPFNPGGKCPH